MLDFFGKHISETHFGLRPWFDPTNKKSWIQIFLWKYLKILEAISHDQINMTEFWLEHDQNFFTTMNVNNRT